MLRCGPRVAFGLRANDWHGVVVLLFSDAISSWIHVGVAGATRAMHTPGWCRKCCQSAFGWRRNIHTRLAPGDPNVSISLTSVDRPEPHNSHDEPRSVRTRPVPRNVDVACDSTSVSSSDARDHMDLLVQVERWEPRELMLRNEIVGDPGELEPGRMSGVSLRTSRICEFIRWRT